MFNKDRRILTETQTRQGLLDIRHPRRVMWVLGSAVLVGPQS